ncbi:hypothetical protein KC340_g8526 [Hortaea werneckii]|nr:hypothetical protein KC342_g979 [Hortaea werneckii]KAI7108846.1 hypothetical protein KC339_g1231 [Hortaea werneckii]KAI7245691.1 hypothetical protein KC365_g230 [Hortaea werneckii]KAI7316812.1 hypothetical protein KC340_g8526 [Hortaea werneckii]KAI7390093.1 hypothetical protein KC328_g8110 [Hortaea werneckii]
MEVSSFGNVPAAQPPTLNPTTEPLVLTFEPNTQDYRGLAESLAEFNATHSYPDGPCENNSAIGDQPIANGQWLENVVQHDLPGVGFYLPDSEYPQNQDNGFASEQWKETQDHDPLVELARTSALEVDGQIDVQNPNSLLTEDNEADNSASTMQATQSKTESPVSAHFENAVKN